MLFINHIMRSCFLLYILKLSLTYSGMKMQTMVLNYDCNCKLQTSILCPDFLQLSVLLPNQSLNNLGQPAELKQTTKAAKVGSKSSQTRNLSAALVAGVISDHSFFFGGDQDLSSSSISMFLAKYIQVSLTYFPGFTVFRSAC